MTVKIADVLQEEVVRDRMEQIVQEDLQFRQAYRSLEVDDPTGGSVKIPRPKDDIGKPEAIGEGQEFPRDEENYEKITVDWTKYGFEIALTKEAQEESMIDVKADQMERQARQMREKLNDLAYTELNNNNNSDTGGDDDGTMTIDDVMEGRDVLRQQGYNPDLLILDIVSESDLLHGDNAVTYVGGANNDTANTGAAHDMLREGAVARVAGLDVVLTNAGHIGTDGEVGQGNTADPEGFVIDTDMYGYEVVKEGVATNQYSDPERQADIIQIWTQRDYHAIDSDAAVKING